MNTRADISPDFRWNKRDAQVIEKILAHEATPQAIQVFARSAWRLTDYAYWFVLGTLWVSYTGWSDLSAWTRLFASARPGRETSLMKPSELARFQALPDPIVAYRAHRPNESDWISYSLDPQEAGAFARRRQVDQVSQYRIPKAHVLCLFLRRGEAEVLVLERTHAEHLRDIPVVVTAERRSGT